jgi:aryl-alcohol dehydrogenase-like predicted oxidoreductase
MKNNKAIDQESNGIHRRNFIEKTIFAGAGLAALAASQNQTSAQTGERNNTKSASHASIGRRRLGKLEVSAVGLGVQNMHRRYETTVPYRPEMISILRAAYDRGITFFDCAEAYGPFENERILGEAIESFRNNVRITSKFGWNIDQQTGRRMPGLNSKPDHIKRVVEGSLKRLRTDRIDLLYQHRVDPEVPIEDVAGAIKALMDQGKVLHWGLSEPGIQTIRRAHAALPLTAIQNEYSMATRDPEKEVIPLCEELGIGVVPWWPLDCQLLTGWIDANTRFAPRRSACSDSEILARESGSQHAVGRSDKDLGGSQAGYSCPDRGRLADGTETLDRAHSRNNGDAAYGGEQWCGKRSLHAR